MIPGSMLRNTPRCSKRRESVPVCLARRLRYGLAGRSCADVTTLALTMVAAVLALTGCQRAGATTNVPDVVVVIASATRNEPDPVLAAPDVAILRNAARGTDGVAYVVNPNNGQPAQVSLTPRRPDGQVDYGPDRGEMLDANLARVQGLVRGEAGDVPFDLVSFIAEATRVSTNPGTLIVISSGLSTAGAFDLRQVGWGADPLTVAMQLKRAGELPDLAGWHVIFSDLAATQLPQPALPLPQRSELTFYWLAICHAAGAASCQVDEVTRPEPASRSTRSVPVVSVPVVSSVRGPSGWSGQNIPSDTFFAFDESTLLPGADRILGPLEAEAVAQDQKMSIAGYSSPDGGTAAYNLALSLRRARAVQARLIALGVPPRQIVEVRGMGTGGIPLSACVRDNRVDEAICAGFRYVVILLSPVLAPMP
jgi:hypothetical protein